MTRKFVYGAALVAFLAGMRLLSELRIRKMLTMLAATAMTLTSIIIPRWISWNSETVCNSWLVQWIIYSSPSILQRSTDPLVKQPSGSHIHYTYGLHKRCSSFTHQCNPFPRGEDCAIDRYFCSMWRSSGFLMSFAVVMEGMTLIAFVVVIAGGKQKRESGWKILSGLLGLVGLIQCTTMALVVSLSKVRIKHYACQIIMIYMN